MAINDDDEIDLYSLYRIAKKKAKLILGLVISAVMITGAINFLAHPVYRSSFIVRIFSTDTFGKDPIVSTGEVEKIISDLELLRKEGQLNELSKRLTIDGEQVKKVVKLSATPQRDANIVEITVDVYDHGLIQDLRNGIILYLNQNPYVNERISLWRDRDLHLKAEIQAKIQKIDEFKIFVLAQMKKDKAKYLGFNPMQLDEEVISLNQRLRDVETSIKLLRGFEVTVEPMIPGKEIKPKKMLNIIIAAITSFLFGVVLSISLESINKLKK